VARRLIWRQKADGLAPSATLRSRVDVAGHIWNSPPLSETGARLPHRHQSVPISSPSVARGDLVGRGGRPVGTSLSPTWHSGRRRPCYGRKFHRVAHVLASAGGRAVSSRLTTRCDGQGAGRRSRARDTQVGGGAQAAAGIRR
jgi:hypothetical protein